LPVDSNDNLYNGDPKFLAEVNAISSTLIDEVLSYLSKAASNQQVSTTLGCQGKFRM